MSGDSHDESVIEDAAADREYEQRRARQRSRNALIAAVLVGALVLGACALLFGLFNRGSAGAVQPPPPPAVQDANFESQQPQWVDCYTGLQCARVKAPLDWADSNGEQIELALVKQPALGGSPRGTLFVNPCLLYTSRCV